MGTKLIALEDGTLVEVEIREGSPTEISGSVAERVRTSLDSLHPILLRVFKPFVSTWQELNKDVVIGEATVEVGLSFEAEGNLYVVKSKSNANVTVTLTLKPPKANTETS